MAYKNRSTPQLCDHSSARLITRIDSSLVQSPRGDPNAENVVIKETAGNIRKPRRACLPPIDKGVCTQGIITAPSTVQVVASQYQIGYDQGKAAADYVHWGATSQDVLDTAMVLQLGEALPPLLEDIEAIVAAFAALAKKHRATPMLGRTLLLYRRRAEEPRIALPPAT